jgi:hypothetical protein
MPVDAEEQRNTTNPEDPESDTDDSGCESGYETVRQSEEDEDDNEWSGQNDNLEALVVSAVDGDYSLAAFLIPLLHRDFNLALKSKVENWRCTATTRAGSDESSESKSLPAEDPTGRDTESSRKRRRTNFDDGRREGNSGWDDDEEEDRPDENKRGKPGPPSGATPESDLLLACPFHKSDSIKYGVHGNSGPGKKSKYRACAGPGFRSIQRLK